MENWMERLEEAKEQGKDKVKELVTERHEFGMTNLHLMAEANAPANFIKAYVDAGADPDARDEQNDTPLHWAADYGSRDAMAGLISSYADINAKNATGDTPLHSAADVSTSRLLISEGADIDAKNKRGQTPLHFAAGDPDKADIAKDLLEKGVNTNAKDKDGDTPLDFAKTIGNDKVVEMLDQRAKANESFQVPVKTPSKSRGQEMEL